MSEEKNQTVNLILNHNAQILGADDSLLFFLVHGRAGNKNVMNTFARALPAGSNIIYPEAPFSDPIGGFSWWDISNNQEKNNQRELSALKLKSFVKEAIDFYKLKPKKVIAVGFSQGAAILSQIMQGRENIFDGVALLSGFVLTDIECQPQKMPSVFIYHGTKDETVSIERAREGRDYLFSLGFKISYFEEEIGHKVGVQGIKELKGWILSTCN